MEKHWLPEEDTGHAPGSERDTQRMEAFSDAVFAIAITLLAVDIKLPASSGADSEVDLAQTLHGLWPSYLAYLFSFVVIGVYWVNHHYTGKLYVKVDHVFNLLNLLFLMAVAFLPFPTRVLAEFMIDEANRQTAATLYATALVLPAGGWLLKWLYASHRRRLVDPHLDGPFLRRLTVRYTVTFAIYLCAALLSLWEYWAGVAIATGLTLLYLLPPPRPVYIVERHRRH